MTDTLRNTPVGAPEGATAPERREFGHVFRRGDTYWIRYSVGGKRYRESAHSTSLRAAEKLLARRQAELGLGAFVAPEAQRLTFDDLATMIRDDYRVRGHRTLTIRVVDGQEKLGGALEDSLARLARVFGDSRARAITTDRVTAYERQLLDGGYARATVNKDLAALRRMFNLAVRARRLPLAAKPFISTPDPRNARQGTFSADDFAAVRAELPTPLQPLFQVAYWTGWRVRDELAPLTWAQVDFAAGVLRLDPNTTKTDEGRVFPFDVLPALKALLEQQRAYTRDVERRTGAIIPFVFHRDGTPIKSFDGAWRSAVDRAAHAERNGVRVVVRPKLVGRVAHDFRRTAARNLIRAGVPQHIVMRLCGWKTDAMFRRYAITDERDLRAAVAALARGTTGAQSASEAAGGAR